MKSVVHSCLLAFLDSLQSFVQCCTEFVNAVCTCSLLHVSHWLGTEHRVCAAVDELRKRLLDESEKVRRRAMVTLGELLFYLCSVDGMKELSDVGEQSAGAVVDAIVCLLQTEEDVVTLHYACKAIDNILATTGFWPQQFAAPGTAQGLLKVRCRTPLLPVTCTPLMLWGSFVAM